MNKSSDIIGMPVISLSGAEPLGCLSDLWFDSRIARLKSVQILCERDDMPEIRYIPADKLQLGENAVLVRSVAALRENNPSTATVRCLINRQAFGAAGNSLGYVNDILLNGSDVAYIETDNGNFTPDRLLSASDSICVFNDTDKEIKIPKKTKRKSTPANRNTKKAAPTERPTPQSESAVQVETPASPASVTVTHTPVDASRDYGFLLGKSVHSPIVSQGRVLIPAGTVVDENVIDFARREGKLVRLALQAY